MRPTVDCFFAPQSPWMFLGHARFVALLQRCGAEARVLPADFGQVFSVSGGLPLPQRSAQRQAYRLLELQRFSEALGVPLNPQPRYFPVASDGAARLIIAADLAQGSAAALKLTGAVAAAIWQQQRNIADPAVLGELLLEQGLDPMLLERSQRDDVNQRFMDNTEAAIAAGVFGAPSYVLNGEIFWGQDRLDFLERRLLA